VRFLAVCVAILSFALFSVYCSKDKSSLPKEESYLNLHDSVKYVGMQTCMQCHSGIHSSFLQTGMGKSLAKASKTKSAAKFNHLDIVHDTSSGYSYMPLWKSDSLIIKEFLVKGKDTIFQRNEIVSYIIGSGQHTNSHLILNKGYLFQAPLTFYTQEKKWDLPPGFEQGANSRFNRILGLECISCHNAYPDFVEGSENKYNQIPEGIDCERCHGPGEIHVSQKQKGILIDTSKYIDYSIVNPAKLSIDKQFDLCQRCHLQGNAVLVNGKSFFDFKPGMNLHEVIEVYLPRYSDSKEKFIMASHADRLQQSACFIQMAKKKGSHTELRPYKNALTCITCHNPHVSVKDTDPEVFIQTCKNCHKNEHINDCSASEAEMSLKGNDCISCHMPVSSSIDIPHVTVHDHYIRREFLSPMSENNSRLFLGLECINNKNNTNLNQARAYLQQFEKFDKSNRTLLDSAKTYLLNAGGLKEDSLFAYWIQLFYLQNNFKRVCEITEEHGHSRLAFFTLLSKDYSNSDAWTAYRIAESFTQMNNHKAAFLYYYIAYKLAPFYFEFSNKLGSSALLNKETQIAEAVFIKLTIENPLFVAGWSNLGYLKLLKADYQSAIYYSNKALMLDYTYLPARLNKAGGLYGLNRGKELRLELQKILEIEPENERAKTFLENL
jgi:hypothetical protein